MIEKRLICDDSRNQIALSNFKLVAFGSPMVEQLPNRRIQRTEIKSSQKLIPI